MYFAVILLATAAVLIFDTMGSLASRRFGFAYSRLMVGSFAIYLAVGLGTASDGSLIPCVLAGGIIGLVDSTLGWAISWRIGPGRPAVKHVTISSILGTVAFVTVLGAAFGAIGGWLRLTILRAAA
jgi:hypothetical protein